MTAPLARVLIVQRDRAYADLLAQWFKAGGFDVTRCAGPHPPDYVCYLLGTEAPAGGAEHRPRIGGYGCPLVEHADVLIYDPWLFTDPESPDAQHLLRRLRHFYPDQPLVLVWAEEGIPVLAPDIRFDPGVHSGPSDPGALVEFVKSLLQNKAGHALSRPATPD
jgi:hypothetical protein